MGNVVEEIFKLNVDTVEQIKNLQNLSGAYEKITAEQREQIVQLKLLEEKEKQLQAARQKSVNPTTQIQITNQIKENKKAIDEATKSVALFASETEEAATETNALAQSISNAFKTTAIVGAGNEVKKLNSVYDETRLRYSNLVKAQAELSIRGRENGVVFKGIKQEAEALGNQLQRAEGGINGFTQKASSGFNALRNSVSQLSREAPAFAVNANTGFLAISNNLPALYDALVGINAQNAKLKAGGEETTSALKQFGSALFSTNTLISLGITLLTVYGGAIAKNIGEILSQKDVFELETETIKILNTEFERQIKLQEDLQKSTNNTSKEIAKLKLNETGGALLDASDKALDKFQEIESGYTKSVGKAIVTQLQLSEKEVDIVTRRSNDVVEIENKKTGTIIRLNREMNQVLGSFSAFYNKAILTSQDVALQAQLNKLDKARQKSLALLNTQFNAEVELIGDKEDEKDKLREKFSEKELIRQRSALDEIRQLKIDNIKDDRQRDVEDQLFKTEKALREIDLANETERKKLSIASSNYQERKAVEQANEKDQKQLNINLIKLNQDYSKEVARIKAENIPKEQQVELRLRLEEELFRKLVAINDKYNEVIYQKDLANVIKTYKARESIINENNSFELFMLEDKLADEKLKGEKASKIEIQRIKDLILAKKIEILKEKAEQDIDNLERNDKGEVNATEELAIRNKLANDIKRLNAKTNNEIERDTDKHTKQQLAKYIDYISQLVRATISLASQIIDIKLKENTALTSQQEKRVQDAKGIADRGNAELLQLEQDRLDKLNKQREKYVRQQQALAAVELVANTAIAVSKAAAQGGVAAGITIAAALIALVAGLASARSIASQAAYYDGGFTGHGNPSEESNTINGKQHSRPFILHKEEFVANHKITRKFRDIFEDVHHGRVDLNEWKEKAYQYDQMVSYKGFTTSAPTQAPSNNITVIEFKGLQSEMKNVSRNISALKFGLNVDEDGFTTFMAKRMERSNHIKKLAKL